MHSSGSYSLRSVSSKCDVLGFIHTEAHLPLSYEATDPGRTMILEQWFSTLRSKTPFTEVTYQISYRSDVYIVIPNSSKVTVVNRSENSFMVGVTTT